MALLPAMRQRLEARFGCPVIDLYSMNEAGPVAVGDSNAGGHVLLQHRLYVEVLDPKGRRLPPGERGEVTLTGGFNFCLPLLRYRTGDYAALRFNGTEPVLIGLEGRPPVRFRTTQGEWLNNIEVTHALSRFAIAQFTLHQDRGGGLQLRVSGAAQSADQIRHTLLELFGAGHRLTVELVASFDAKTVQVHIRTRSRGLASNGKSASNPSPCAKCPTGLGSSAIYDRPLRRAGDFVRWARNARPVCDFRQAATASGVPATISCPP